jgi:hypothetical protein
MTEKRINFQNRKKTLTTRLKIMKNRNEILFSTPGATYPLQREMNKENENEKEKKFYL